MTRKKRNKAKYVMVGVIAVLILLFSYMAKKNVHFSVGRIVMGEDGGYVFVVGKDSYTGLIDRKKHTTIFNQYNSGDLLLVIHGGLGRGFLGKTEAYSVYKIKDGTLDDLSQEGLEVLAADGVIQDETRRKGTEVKEYELIGVAGANWWRKEEIKNEAVNAEDVGTKSVMHLPVCVLDTYDRMKMFAAKYGNSFVEQEIANTFSEVISQVEPSFFDDHILLAVLTMEDEEAEVQLKDIYYNNDRYCIYIELTEIPEESVGTAGRFFVIAMDKSKIDEEAVLDAIMLK